MNLTKPLLILSATLFPLAVAQRTPTCDTLMAELKTTATETASVTRTLTMRAGDRELSHSVVKVVQEKGNLEVKTLEQRGRLPPGQEDAPESSLLGLPPGLNCEDHTLTTTEDGYELSLTVADKENPIDSVVLGLERRGGRLVPLGYAAAGSVTQLFFTTAISLSMSYGNWAFR